MRLRSSLSAAAVAALLAPTWGAQAQSVAPAAPAEAAIDGTQPVQAANVSELPPTIIETEENSEATAIDAAPDTANAIEYLDVVIEGTVTSVRTRETANGDRLYELSDIAEALRSRIEMQDAMLGYHRFQDGAFMSIDMADGKVRSNRIVLGKLPDFEPREQADPWIGLNAVSVMTGTHVSTDGTGRTVLTLDQQLKPQFGLEVWVSGAPIDTFGNEARTIGPVLLVPLEPITEALGHQMTMQNGVISVRRTQDQAEIQLELATGLVSINGTPRGVTPDMQFAERDTLLLPFSAVETLTGTHIKLAPGTSRVQVTLDDRLDTTALPGQEISDEVRNTPFTPEALRFELSDRGPLKLEFSSHAGKYNTRARMETNGGVESLSSSQPAWASVDIQSLDGWAATIGDYNTAYRELAGLGQARVRGASWRQQKPSGTIIAIAAGVPLSGASIESDTVAVPEFGGFAGGARIISKDQSQDYGVAASLSEDGDDGLIVAGGQKRFDFRDNETGMQSAYVSADVGVFTGDKSGADVRVRASANYAVSQQLGLSASTSYDGEKFLSGAGQSEFAGVFDNRVGARTAVTGAAYWRSVEPWGVLNQFSVGTHASLTDQGGDTDATSQSLSVSVGAQIAESGPSISATLTQSNEDRAGLVTDTTNLRVRGMQRFDWGSITASYVNSRVENEPSSQQLVASVLGNAWRKGFKNGANITVSPTATLNWNGEKTDIRAGASISADAGRALGRRLNLTARLSALSDFAAEEAEAGTRFYGNLQARYRVARNIELAAIYSDDFSGNKDLSIALRGVLNFNDPRRHSLPDGGKGILTGNVYLDRNRDGVRQPDEPGIGGVRVSVRGTGLGLNAGRGGQFTIQNVKQGLYVVAVNKRSLPLGYMVPENAEPRVTIADGHRTNVDIPVILSGQVRGAIFVDGNANGVTDSGERRLEGQWIKLIPEVGGEPMVIQSASFGQYGFENVPPGRYRLEVQVSGIPVTQEIEVSDEDPFIVQPVPVPPDLFEDGGGADFTARVRGEA